MSEVTDLVVIEKSNAMAVFTSSEQLDPLIAAIESEARSLVPDVTTKKGRDAIASMAHKVARSKTYIDNAGKDLVAELKALPKQIDESRRLVRERLDALKDEVRRPLTEWEAEQERIAAEKAAEEERLRIEAEEKAALEALKKQFEADHEMALLMNKDFDRDAAEAKAEVESQRTAHEEELKRQAAEQAKREAAEAAQREIDAAAAREREALLAKERAEREAKDAADLAERNRIAAEQKAEADRLAAAEKAERDKQEAIAEEKRKAQAEADRIKREADEKEQTRLAEEKRIADEAAKRAADIEHRRTINRQSVAELVAAGLPADCAQKCVEAIAKGAVAAIRITY